MSTVCSFGQCYKETKDEFTGRTLRATESVNISWGLSSGMLIDFYKSDTSIYFNVTYTKSDKRTFFVNKGAEFILILNDDSKVTIYAADIFKTKFNPSANSLKAFYNISSNDIKRLSSVGIKKVRLYYEDTYSDEDFNDRKNNRLKDIFNCILTA